MRKRRSNQRVAQRQSVFELLEDRRLLAADPFGTNQLQSLDVNRDGRVSALDALLIINAIGRSDVDRFAIPEENIGEFLDVNRDGRGSALDALNIVNALGRREPLMVATLAKDSAPDSRTDLAFDLRTNEYALNLSVSVGQLEEHHVELRVGESGSFLDITNEFLDNKASLSAADIDAVFGSALPDGDHPITVRIVDGDSVQFVLTVDRSAPVPQPVGGPLLRVAPDALEVSFGEPIAATDMANGTFTLTQTGGSAIDFTSTETLTDGFRFGLVEKLQDASFQLTYSGGATDLVGNIATPSTQSFSVADPVGIASISPRNGERQVNVKRETIIEFDEPVDPTSVTTDAIQVIAAGEEIPGNIRVNRTGMRATYFYDSPLPPSTAVSVVINGQMIRGIDGLELDADADNEPGGDSDTSFRTLPLTLIPGTELFGYVKDSQTQQPLSGVVISLDAYSSISATTDENGYFELGVDDADGDGVSDGLPAPDFFAFIDGSSAVAPDGSSYAYLGKPFASVPGQRTQLNMAGVPFDIFLPPIPSDAMVPVVPGQETLVSFGNDSIDDLVQMMPNVDPQLFQQMQVIIPPDAAINDAGQQATQAFVIPVDPDYLPAPLPPSFEPALVVSIQAPGTTNFDVPVPVQFPNLEGLAPGEKALLFSFNHDAGRFEINGTMTVSEDGLSVVSDPGVGIEAPGWHGWRSGSRLSGFLRRLSDFAQKVNGFLGAIQSLYEIFIRWDPLGSLSALSFLNNISLRASDGHFSRDDAIETLFDIGEIGSGVIAATTCRVPVGPSGLACLGSLATSTALKVRNVVEGARGVADGTINAMEGNPPEYSPTRQEAIRRKAEQLKTRSNQLQSALPAIESIERQHSAAVEAIIGPEIRQRFPNNTSPLDFEFDANGRSRVRNVDTGQYLLDSVTGDPITIDVRQLPTTRSDTQFYSDLISRFSPYDFRQASSALELRGGYEQIEREINSIENRVSDLMRDLRDLSEPIEDVKVRISGPDFDQVLNTGTLDDVVVPPNTPLVITATDRTGTQFARFDFFSGSNGSRTPLPSDILLATSTDTDSDGDGLPDEVETVIGTHPDNRDTDTDGVSDAAEWTQGLDPLGGLLFPSGPIANLSAQGEAEEVVVESVAGVASQAAFVATGSHGLAVADVSQFDNPILLGEIDLPGNSIDLALDRRQQIVAVAAQSGGLHLVDVSQLDQPELINTVGVRSDQVAIDDGIVYTIGDQRLGQYALTDGSQLSRLNLQTKLDDIAVFDGTIFVLSSSDLIAFSANPDGLIEIGRIAVAGSVSPLEIGRRLHVDDGIAYVGAFDGYRTVDISDPSSLSILGSPGSTQEAVHDIATNGSGLVLPVTSFSGANTLALARYDGRDPADVTAFQTRFETPGDSRATAIASGIAYVADGDAGLTVVNYLAFDSDGNAPVVTANLQNNDVDAGTAGIQLQEGTYVDFDIQVVDDVQVQQVELLFDGEVVARSVAVPFDLQAQAGVLADGETDRLINLQVRAVDTGGNETLTSPLEFQLIADTDAPSVTFVTPPDSSVRLEGYTTLVIGFSEPVQIDALPADAIRLVAASDSRTISPQRYYNRLNGREVLAIFEPLEIDDYELVVDRVFQDLSGNELISPVTSGFSIIPNTDPGESFVDAFDLGELVGSDSIHQTIGINDENGDPDPVDVYRFTSTSFQDLELSLNGRTDAARIYLAQDRNADGLFDLTDIEMSRSSNAAEDISLSTSVFPGEYFIWIDTPSSQDATAYTLNYRVSELEVPPVVIQSGETIVGEISELGEVDFLEFDAVAGATLFLNYDDNSSLLRGGVFVFAPDGSLLTSLEDTDSVSFTNLPLSISGTYTILVRDLGGNATGGYGLTAVVIDGNVDANNTPLISGQTREDSLSLGDIDTFTIDALAGTKLFLNYDDNNSLLRSGVFVFAPDGSLLTSLEDTDSVSFTNLPLSVSGTYTILVRDLGGDAVGDYRLTAVVIDNVIDDDNVALTSGQTVLESLSLGDIDTFTIDALAGNTLFLNYDDNNSLLRSGVFVFAPDGSLLTSLEDTDSVSFTNLPLSVSGTYTILVRDLGGDAVGDYGLTAVVIDNVIDDDNVALISGQTVLESLSLGDIDTFTIDATAGTTLFLNYDDNNSLLRSGVFVFAPDGSLLTSLEDTDSVSFTNLPLSVSGTYTILVRDLGGDAVGDYGLTAVVIDNVIDDDNVALTSGQTVLESLSLGDIDTFTIDAMAGTTLFLNYDDNNSLLRSGVFVFAPDGSLLTSLEDTDSVSFTNLPLSISGTYTILVRDFDGNEAGDYGLTAVVIDNVFDDDNVVLTSGQSITDSLSLGDIDTFTINATAGSKLTLSYAEISSGLDAGVFLYAPDGSLLQSEDGQSTIAFADLMLLADGLYTLVVRDLNGDASGDYMLQVDLA
ncbi:Ig-like domain-containing protein [Stieleria varia]|uniref:Ig-like domain-containing protein n=1 Tax=Stieleria varia TaxID=2528005 RepID=UPI00313C6A2D